MSFPSQDARSRRSSSPRTPAEPSESVLARVYRTETWREMEEARYEMGDVPGHSLGPKGGTKKNTATTAWTVYAEVTTETIVPSADADRTYFCPAVTTFLEACSYWADMSIVPTGLLWDVYDRYVSLTSEPAWKPVNAFWRFLDKIQMHQVLRYGHAKKRCGPSPTHALIYGSADTRRAGTSLLWLHYMPRYSKTVTLTPDHIVDANYLLDSQEPEVYTVKGHRDTLLFANVGTMESSMQFRHQLKDTIGRTFATATSDATMHMYDAMHMYDVYKSLDHQNPGHLESVAATLASHVRIGLCHLAIACRVLRPGGTYMFELRISRKLKLGRCTRDLLYLCREAFGSVCVYRSVYTPLVSYTTRLMCVCTAYKGACAKRDDRLLDIIDALGAIPAHQRVQSVLRVTKGGSSASPSSAVPPLPPEWDAECDRLEAHIWTNSQVVSAFATFANTYLTPYLSGAGAGAGSGSAWMPPRLMSRIRHHQKRLALDFARRLFYTEEHPIPRWTLSEKETTKTTKTTTRDNVLRVYVIDIPGVLGTSKVLADVRAAALRTRTTADAMWFWNATQRMHVVVQSYPFVMANMYPTGDHGDRGCVLLALLDHPFHRLLHSLRRVFGATRGTFLYPLKTFWARHNITNRKQFFQAPAMLCKQLLYNKCFAPQAAYCARHGITAERADEIPVDCVRSENVLRTKLANYTGCPAFRDPGQPATHPLPSLTTAEGDRIKQLYAEDFAFVPVFARMYAPLTPQHVYVTSGLKDGGHMSSFLLGEWLPLMMYLRAVGLFDKKSLASTTREPCVVHIWRHSAVSSSLSATSAQQEAQQNIYDDLSAYHNHSLHYVIHASAAPPLVDVHVRATYYELESFEHQSWSHLATTTNAVHMRDTCKLLGMWAREYGRRATPDSPNPSPTPTPVHTINWPHPTKTADHPLEWHEWIASLGKATECVLPAPEWCKQNQAKQGFADYASLHWLLFLKSGTRVRWTPTPPSRNTRTTWTGAKREWLWFLQTVFRLRIPQLLAPATIGPTTRASTRKSGSSDHVCTARTSRVERRSRRSRRSRRRSTLSPAPATTPFHAGVHQAHQVPTLPILRPDNRSEHCLWHAYYESVYHHPVSDRVDLNTFTWFYHNAPFAQPVCPRIRWSKMWSETRPHQTSPTTSPPPSPDWMGDTALTVHPHKDRNDRDQLRLRPNDAFTGHLPPPFPTGGTKPMNVVTLYGFFVKRNTGKTTQPTPPPQRQEVIRIGTQSVPRAAWFWCVRGSGVFWDIASYLQGKHLVRVRDRRELVKRFAKWLPPNTRHTLDTNAGIDAFDVEMPQLLRHIAGRETGVRAVQIEHTHGVPELFVVDRALLSWSGSSSRASSRGESEVLAPSNIHSHVNLSSSGNLQLNRQLTPHQLATSSIHVGASTGVRVPYLSTGDAVTPIRPVHTLTEERLVTSLPYGTDTPPWLTSIQHECLQCLRTYSHGRTTDTRALREWCLQYRPPQLRRVLNTWIPVHMCQRVTTTITGHTNLQYVDVCCTPFGIAAIMGCPLTVLRVLLQHGAEVHAPCPPVLHGRLLRFLRRAAPRTPRVSRRRTDTRNAGTRNAGTRNAGTQYGLCTVSAYLHAIMDSVNTMPAYRKRVLRQLLRV